MARQRGVLVGRDVERARLREALDDTTGGAGRVVLVHGEAGIGKTRLLEAVAEDASTSGFLVLCGGAIPSGLGLPFGPVIEAFGTLLAERDPGELSERLGGPDAWDLLARLDPTRPIPDHRLADTLAQPRLYAAFTKLLVTLSSSSPVALLLEDLHWADASSLALLAWVARSTRSARLLVIASWRDPVGLDAPLRGAIPELMRHPASLDLALGPLDANSTSSLLLQLRPSLGASELARLTRACGGNPFYAVALAEESHEGQVPPRLAEILRRAYTDAGPDARTVLQVLALLSRRVEYELVEAVTRLDGACLDAALDEVLEARLVDADDNGLQLRHALLADAVSAGLRPARRRALHAAIVSGLTARQQVARVAPAELAHHLAAAGDAEGAASAALAAAREARLRLAFAEAELHLGNALRTGTSGELGQPGTRLQLLLEAADLARWGTRNRPEEADWLSEAQELAIRLDDAVALAHVECARGRLRWARGDAPGSLAAYERALNALPDGAPTLVRAEVLTWLATGEMIMSHHPQARATAHEALRLAAPEVADVIWTPTAEVYWPVDAARAGLALHALITESTAAAWVGDIEAALAGLRAALAAAARRDDTDARCRAYGNLTFALAVAGDWQATAATAAEGLDWTRRHGLDASGAVLVNNRISALVALGRWEEAEREADAALAQTNADGVALTLHLTLAELAALRGEDISAHLLAAAALPGAGADPQLVLYETCARAEQALWRGDPESARLLVTEALQSPHMRDYAYGRLRLATLLLRADADIAELARAPGARATLEDALARTGPTLATVESARSAGPGTQALLCLARAEAARVRVAADGATSSLADFWSTAAQAWAEAGEAYPRAYARFREGSSLLMAGRPAAALPILADAFAGAHRLGAQPLARACAAVARAAGVERELMEAASLHAEREAHRSRAPVPPGPRLTLRERQVLEQLAQGSTNRVAARRLGISEKTVAVHLTNVYAKLGVTNRTEAVSVALRSGLVTVGTTG